MKIKQGTPFNLPSPVEAAFEANEAAVPSNKVPTQNGKITINESNDDPTPRLVKVPIGSIPPLRISSIPRNTISREAECKREIVRKLKYENEFIEVQLNPNDNNHIEVVSSTKSDGLDANGKARYEIPDISLSRTAVKILGNRKELEMHEFSASMKKARNREQQQQLLQPQDNDDKSQNISLRIDPTGDRQLTE